MPLYRVYRYYVGCHVYDVEAPDAKAAHEKLEYCGDGPGIAFLHEANEPWENRFFTDVFSYDANREVGDFPAYESDPFYGEVWRTYGDLRLPHIAEVTDV